MGDSEEGWLNAVGFVVGRNHDREVVGVFVGGFVGGVEAESPDFVSKEIPGEDDE